MQCSGRAYTLNGADDMKERLEKHDIAIVARMASSYGEQGAARLFENRSYNGGFGAFLLTVRSR